MSTFTRLILATLIAAAGPLVRADDVLVAVASNFTAPMTELGQRFTALSGHRVTSTFGSSGRFFAQISNGAPFQVFLSADQDKPAALEAAGLVQPGQRFTYAQGALVLWSAAPDAVAPGPDTLRQGQYRRLAMANPRLAPYGRAAMQVLEALDLVSHTRDRWVQGENIAQTYQFVSSGNAELGFVALSQVIEGDGISQGRGWQIPAHLHEPIRQDAVLLANARDCSACLAFMNFLQSAEAAKIISSYGYVVP